MGSCMLQQKMALWFSRFDVFWLQTHEQDRQIYQVYLYICIDKNTQLFHNYSQQRKLAQQNKLVFLPP